MSTVPLSPQDIIVGGTVPSYTSPLTTNTYNVSNDGRVFLHFIKTGANPCNVVVPRPATYKGASIASLTDVVPATTGNVMMGPFSPDLFNDGNGNLAFTVSEITGLTVAVLHLPPAP